MAFLCCAWEQRKLDELADVRDGTHASPKYVESGYPLVTSKNIQNGKLNFKEIQYISKKDYEEINKRSKVDINDILLSMIGTIGSLSLIQKEPFFAIKNVGLIKNIEKINSVYLYEFLQSPNIKEQINIAMNGGTQKFLALNKIRNLHVLFPSVDEQSRIAIFLSNYDNLITLHQRKLN